MPSTTILMATETLDQFIGQLDAVYWEATTVDHIKPLLRNVQQLIS